MWGDTGPGWLSSLIAAEVWGTPPWIIDPGEPIWVWLMRLAELTRLRVRRRRMDLDKYGRK